MPNTDAGRRKEDNDVSKNIVKIARYTTNIMNLTRYITLCASVVCLFVGSAAAYGEIRTLRTQYVVAESGECYTMPERPVLYARAASAGEIEPLGENGDANGHVIEVSFDEMSQDFRQYTYTVRHLNADGSEDNLATLDYIEGFTTQDITDYAPSLNTRQIYTHYRFLFPNADMRVKVSGRYEIVIYEDGDVGRVVARVPVYVADSRVRVDGKVLSSTDIELSGRYQQLEIEVTTDGNSTNLRDDYFVVVRQNGRIDNQVVAPPPTFVDGKTLRWQHCRPLIFEGGDEYRHFDAYSTYYAGTGIDRIVYEMGDYHALLNADELRAGSPYSHEFDVDGQYRVHAERVQDEETEAEYMWVHWLLKAELPFVGGAVYVGGDLFGNTFSLKNRMDYDNELKCYYLTAPVKQGGYDYQYWFVPKGENRATLLRTEGSHWETRNEYMVYVYYKPFGARYEQLVGVKRL